MAAPRPATFFEEWEKLASSIQAHDPRRCERPGPDGIIYRCLACEYRWAYNAAHDRTVGDSVKTRGPATSGTEIVVEGKAATREACRQAFRQLKSAVTALGSIEPILRKGIGHADGGHTPTDSYPPGSTMLSPEEKALTMSAAARRRERGDGFGEG